MKKFCFFMLLSLVALATGFVSCSDDDDDDNKQVSVVGFWKMAGSPWDVGSMMKSKGMVNENGPKKSDIFILDGTQYVSEYYAFYKDLSIKNVIAQYDKHMNIISVDITEGKYRTTSDGHIEVKLSFDDEDVESDIAQYTVKGNTLTITYSDDGEAESMTLTRVNEKELKPLFEWTSPIFNESTLLGYAWELEEEEEVGGSTLRHYRIYEKGGYMREYLVWFDSSDKFMGCEYKDYMWKVENEIYYQKTVDSSSFGEGMKSRVSDGTWYIYSDDDFEPYANRHAISDIQNYVDKAVPAV